jgi:hypothetical protein
VQLHTPQRTVELETRQPAVNLAQAAMEWTYVVRSRLRWASTDAAKQQRMVAAKLLDDMGVNRNELVDLARAGVVEVATKWTGEEESGWPARILPWEYVLTAATADLRGKDQPLTVIRHLDRGASSPALQPPHSVLFVFSEPGPLKGRYVFDSERALVQSQFANGGGAWHELSSPTLDELQQAIATHKPDLVHLAGFDSHEAAEILAKAQLQSEDDGESAASYRVETRMDGYVLAGDNGLDFVSPDRLGTALTFGHRPSLVSLNIRNSAARIAPQLVAAGVSAAIGFQDNFDDPLAEFFFTIFYRQLSDAVPNLRDAFQEAWIRTRQQPGRPTQGTGIVLWSDTRQVLHTAARPTKGVVKEEKALLPENVPAGEVRDWIKLEMEPVSDINYSMLHNKRSLFKRFQLKCTKQTSQVLRDVRVRVSLSVGNETAVFDRTLDVRPPVENIPDIFVPLTSVITRSVHESVQTSLFVEVTWGDHVVHRDTTSVRLIPVDQWRDSDEDRKWLPSFVFPRDSAVTHLIDVAQRYVRVLRDDPAAGFDGYQSFDPKRPDSVSEVDLQVQAIWSAIVHELRLGYINPPPGYSSELDSQRLRTPSMIAESHSGTCIDLALFFASCLELVDIYPVVFLLEGHAFPGYWRSSNYHGEFTKAHPADIQDIVRADSSTTSVSGAQREGWLLGKPTYDEIVQFVNAGKLVPLETVRLTENCGFWEAIDSGRDNLRPKREFAAMVDIALARENQVTPLPILGDDS